jgi:hypothetical protein
MFGSPTQGSPLPDTPGDKLPPPKPAPPPPKPQQGGGPR